MPLSRIVRDIRDLKRFEQILATLLKYKFGFFLKKVRLKGQIPAKKRMKKKDFEDREKETAAVRMRLVFEELGGTFIKLGQLLSLRPDLVPEEYCDEFSKLQDEVPPFPGKEAEKIVEKELKKPLKELFSEFELKPIAAASIGQVHKAKLKNGTDVIVKVQRPGIRELIDTDVDIMYYLAHLIEKHYQDLFFDPTDIVKEFEKYTKRELSYVIEAKNVDRFYKNFTASKTILIPKVYWEYTTSRVLTLGYIKGKTITGIEGKSGYDKKKITYNLINAIFQQIFIDGFFHADPHPGNILILPGNKVALLDFGIVGFLDKQLKDKMINLFVSMIEGNLDGIAEGLYDLGFVEYSVDMEHLKEAIYENLREFYGTSFKQVSMASVFPKLINVAKENKIILPANFVLLGKSLVTTEGFCQELDPDFNVVETARPFIRKMIQLKKQPKEIFKEVKRTGLEIKNFVTSLPNQTKEALRTIKDADLVFKSLDTDLQRLTMELDKSSNRIALGMMAGALIIGGALLFNYDQQKIFDIPLFSFLAFAIAGFLVFLLLISVLGEFRKRF